MTSTRGCQMTIRFMGNSRSKTKSRSRGIFGNLGLTRHMLEHGVKKVRIGILDDHKIIVKPIGENDDQDGPDVMNVHTYNQRVLHINSSEVSRWGRDHDLFSFVIPGGWTGKWYEFDVKDARKISRYESSSDEQTTN